MNKIIIANDEIKSKKLDDSINVIVHKKNEAFNVNTIDIIILKDTELEIRNDILEDTKLYINFSIKDNVNAYIFDIRTGSKVKIQYNYNLGNESNLVVNKFYDCNNVREVDIIDLDGFKANIKHYLKTISTNYEKYDIIINHNNSCTISHISNNGINILDGQLIFNVTGYVANGKKECNLNQENRIITMNENKCAINPNLLIDENDVSASHSALIGKFNDEEIFYLRSRGISEKNAVNLLVKGLLLSKLSLTNKRKEELENIIDKYWR